MTAYTPPPANQPRIAARSLIHRGKKFDFEMLTVERPTGRTLRREVVRHPGAVVIVPILEAGEACGGRGEIAPEKSIVLIRNFRIALGQELVECCAGTIERPRLPDRDGQSGGFGEGEPPERCAARELIEETGYQAGRFTSLGWFYTTPGLTDEQMFVFAATGLTHVGQKLEEDESIRVEVVAVPRVFEMIARGEMRDAKSMLALLMAQRAGLI